MRFSIPVLAFAVALASAIPISQDHRVQAREKETHVTRPNIENINSASGERYAKYTSIRRNRGPNVRRQGDYNDATADDNVSPISGEPYTGTTPSTSEFDQWTKKSSRVRRENSYHDATAGDNISPISGESFTGTTTLMGKSNHWTKALSGVRREERSTSAITNEITGTSSGRSLPDNQVAGIRSGGPPTDVHGALVDSLPKHPIRATSGGPSPSSNFPRSWVGESEGNIGSDGDAISPDMAGIEEETQ